MPLMRMLVEPALIVHAQTALGTSQEELGKKLGVSRRTMTRWMRKQSYPSPLEWANLARLVYPRNRALAEQIASGLKESLVTLGIEAPPAPPPPPPPPPPHARSVAARMVANGAIVSRRWRKVMTTPVRERGS